jgi:hypothetical protein
MLCSKLLAALVKDNDALHTLFDEVLWQSLCVVWALS